MRKVVMVTLALLLGSSAMAVNSKYCKSDLTKSDLLSLRQGAVLSSGANDLKYAKIGGNVEENKRSGWVHPFDELADRAAASPTGVFTAKLLADSVIDANKMGCSYEVSYKADPKAKGEPDKSKITVVSTVRK